MEEVRLLQGYVMRMHYEAVESMPPDVSGRTVGDLIEQQRLWERANAGVLEARQEHASRWKERLAEAQRAMGAAVGVTIQRTLDSSGPDSTATSRSVIVHLGLENRGTRAVTGIEGAIRFADVYGREIFECPITIRDPLAAGTSAEISEVLGCAAAFGQENRLHHVRLVDCRASWEYRSIRFESGEVLAVSDE